MFYPLNRDLRKVFFELHFLRFFCILYFGLYLLFVYLLKFNYVWSMTIPFVITVFLMSFYIFCCKRKLKTSLNHLWLSETEVKIEKVSRVLEEHGFSSNNEKLALLMDYYKNKIKNTTIFSDIFSFIVVGLFLFLPMLINSKVIDSYLFTQMLSCVGILFLIYLGYLLFKKIWNFSITDIFNGQAFVRESYEILFYIYCRKMNEITFDKKNLKKVAYELKRSN